jgi:hypothetical protein
MVAVAGKWCPIRANFSKTLWCKLIEKCGRKCCGSGSRISSESGSKLLMTKDCKKIQLKTYLFDKIYLSLPPYRMSCSSYRRRLQPSKSDIYQFFYFYGSFLPSWIRFQSGISDPDPQHCSETNLFWNQILICLSERFSIAAISILL